MVAYEIALKRVYDEPAETDGARILVERLWPRGVSKQRARIQEWLKDVAPSPELRRWYGHKPDRWPEFQTRYRQELENNESALRELERLCAAGPVTFVFAAKDRERNSAWLLRNFLLGGRR